jgi:protein-disulfide isomerase
VISLVEYGDFECPYCRAAEPIVAGLMEALGDQLSVTFRHFPMLEVHPHGQYGAEVAEAAAAQGKFWEMHDMLFANQNALDDASLVKHAADLAWMQSASGESWKVTNMRVAARKIAGVLWRAPCAGRPASIPTAPVTKAL